MKAILKIIFYFLVFLFFLLVFLPKTNLYYELEKQLQKQDVIISNETIDESIFNLQVNAGDVYVKGIFASNINKLDLTSYLFYTKVNLDGIRFSQGFSNMVPTPIDNVSIIHSIIDPTKAKISGNSIYGTLEGYIDLVNSKIYLELKATPKMKSNYSKILNMMKLKDERYIYEYNY